MSFSSNALCERCGSESANPHDVEIFMNDDAPDANETERVAYFLCDACAEFLHARQPVFSSEIVDESAMIASLGPIRAMVTDVSRMQAEIDALRGQITHKKTYLRHAVRKLCTTISEEQWRRLIQAEQMKGESSLVFWLEKYRSK